MPSMLTQSTQMQVPACWETDWMRKYESVTGHIRCSICHTRLLAGRLDTGVRQAQAMPEDVTLPAVEPSGSTISPLEAGWPKGGPYRCPRPAFRPACRQAVEPSGSTICRAIWPDYQSGPQAGLTQVLPPTVVVVDAASSPMPPRCFEYQLDCRSAEVLRSRRAFELAGLALDPCEPDAGLVRNVPGR